MGRSESATANKSLLRNSWILTMRVTFSFERGTAAWFSTNAIVTSDEDLGDSEIWKFESGL